VASKRNKKYNRIEAQRLNNLYALKGCAVAFIASDKSSSSPIKLVDLKGNNMRITRLIADAISNYRYKWSIMIAVFCIEKDEPTCKFEIVDFKQPYFQNELVDYLNEQHKSFIQKQKDKNVQVTGAGWLASPTSRDFSTQEAGRIFDKLGGLE